MPFQLDTSMYGGLGAAPRQQQSSPLGMLGDLMDIKTRQENLRGLREQRASIEEQRQLAISKARDEQQTADNLMALYPDENADPSESDLIKAGLTPEQAAKTKDAHLKMTGQQRTTGTGYMSSVAASTLGLPEPMKQAAWTGYLQQGVKQGHITPEQAQQYATFSPEIGQSFIDAALTPEQIASAQTARGNLKVAQSAEERLAKTSAAELPGKVAKSTEEVRAEAAPRLANVRPGDWEAYAANYGAIPKDQRSGFPTVQDFLRDPVAAKRKLGTLGVSPAEQQAHVDRMTALAESTRQFNEQQKRLSAQGGITDSMRQSALVRRANDVQSLEQEKSRRADQGQPMGNVEELQRRTQIDQNYRAETHEPPDLKLAEDLKKASLDALDEKILKRSRPGPADDQGVVTPANPMTEKAIKAEKLAILNRYRADHGLGPVTALGPEWGYGDGSSPQDNTIGALTNTVPPVATPPVRSGAAQPVVNPTVALTQVQREIDDLKAASGTAPTPAQVKAYQALRARKQAILAQRR